VFMGLNPAGGMAFFFESYCAHLFAAQLLVHCISAKYVSMWNFSEIRCPLSGNLDNSFVVLFVLYSTLV